MREVAWLHPHGKNSISTHSSYQGLFELEHHPEYDPVARRFGRPISLKSILERCADDPEEVARFLFARVILTDGEGSLSKIGYSYACVAYVASEPCLFLGCNRPGHAMGRGYPPSFLDEHLAIQFEFWSKDGTDHVQLNVDLGTEVVRITGFELYHWESQFFLFLAGAAHKKRVTILYPDSNFMASQPWIHRRTRPVGFFTRRRLVKLLKAWPAAPLEE